MTRQIKTLAETGYFRKTLNDRNVLRYMRLFYKNLLKPGRARALTIRRMTLYTCQFVFPPTRGYTRGRACIDDVYGLPDPDCPACNGTGHPQKSDSCREIKVMGMIVPLTPEELQAEMFGNIVTYQEKLLVGLPLPPEYTRLFGLKPKTDILDKNGSVIDKDVYIGYRLENDDIVIRTIDYWDGFFHKEEKDEFIITKKTFNDAAIGYFRMFHTYIVQPKTVDSHTEPQPRQG